MAYVSQMMTNIWANVRKLEEHLNPKGEKCQFNRSLQIRSHLGTFYRNHSIKVLFES
jgi:hypothetical protein